MSKRTICRPIAALLAVVMVLMLLGGVPMRAAAEGTTYVLDATADLAAFAAGEKADGDNEDVGTEGYFTVFYSAKTKVDGSSKTFDDGYSATQRLNFGGSSAFDPMKNTVRFTTSAPAEVKLWWVSGGDGRTMTIWDSTGAVVCATDAAESVKNALYISAFFNKVKGIDSNSCPDIIVYDSVAYNNESYNVAFYTNNAGDTDFQANGIISFKDERVKSGLTIGDNLKPRGTQDPAKYLGESNFYWNGSASVNTGGAQITADDFVSLEFTGVAWNADGTIDLQGFLELDRPFDDVRMGEFYYDAVLWAVEKGITNGTAPDTFSPENACLRAQVVTFLWRANGSPEPTITENPFVDVKESDFFYKAVLWAVEKGITNGVDATHFAPADVCSRAQAVTFLHRSLGCPDPVTGEHPFVDVKAGSFYGKAAQWACGAGITTGMDETHFAPEGVCTRAHVITFLFRALA